MKDHDIARLGHGQGQWGVWSGATPHPRRLNEAPVLSPRDRAATRNFADPLVRWEVFAQAKPRRTYAFRVRWMGGCHNPQLRRLSGVLYR